MQRYGEQSAVGYSSSPELKEYAPGAVAAGVGGHMVRNAIRPTVGPRLVANAERTVKAGDKAKAAAAALQGATWSSKRRLTQNLKMANASLETARKREINYANKVPAIMSTKRRWKAGLAGTAAVTGGSALIAATYRRGQQ